MTFYDICVPELQPTSLYFFFPQTNVIWRYLMPIVCLSLIRNFSHVFFLATYCLTLALHVLAIFLLNVSVIAFLLLLPPCNGLATWQECSPAFSQLHLVWASATCRISTDGGVEVNVPLPSVSCPPLCLKPRCWCCAKPSCSTFYNHQGFTKVYLNVEKTNM